VSGAKFTPGPWEIAKFCSTLVVSAAGRSTASAGGHFSNKLADGGLAENEANARLIAAAPDLYAALVLMVKHFGDPLRVANAAIAKAEGR